MHFQVKMPDKDSKTMLRDKQETNREPLMFLDLEGRIESL